MPLAYRLAAGFSALLAVMVVTVLFQLSLLRRQSEEISRLADSPRRTEQLVSAIELDLVDLISTGQKFIGLSALGALGAFPTDEQSPTDAAGYQEHIETLRESITSNIGQLSRLRLSEAEIESMQALRESWADFLRTPIAARIVAEISPTSQPLPRQRIDELQAEVEARLMPVRGRVEEVRDASSRQLERQARRSRSDAGRAEIAAQVGGLLGLLLALGASAYVVNLSVLRPLRRLGRGARAIAEGDFTYRVEASGSPEFVALAEDFNSMARRLSQLDQLKKDLISNVSHDLKAPLASMLETTRLLLEGLPGPLTEKQARLLRLNLGSGERLSRMIADLLDLSRLEAAPASEEFLPLDLRRLVSSAVGELWNLARERELTVDLDLAESATEVEGHGSSLAQAVTNLVSNALKFTPRGGSVGVRLCPFSAARPEWLRHLAPSVREAVEAHAQAGAVVEVWDSGPGVPEEHKQRIFQRFHRVDTGRRGAQGTGLGLAIAHTIVLQHRGALWDEDRPGGGSRFLLLLWRRPPVPAPAEVPG